MNLKNTFDKHYCIKKVEGDGLLKIFECEYKKNRITKFAILTKMTKNGITKYFYRRTQISKDEFNFARKNLKGKI